MFTDLLWNWVPWLYNKYTDVLLIGNKVYKSVYKVLYEEENVLFIRGSLLPISQELFDTSTIDKHIIKWKATVDPPRFIDSTEEHKTVKLKHISYLSFTVNIPGGNNLDLSDWINEIKWSGIIQPSPQEIFTLWCCKNRSPLLFYRKDLTIEIISDTGDVIKRGLNDSTHSNIYKDDDDSKTHRPDPDWYMDIVLSSSGR
jgi:hypothetical protein